MSTHESKTAETHIPRSLVPTIPVPPQLALRHPTMVKLFPITVRSTRPSYVVSELSFCCDGQSLPICWSLNARPFVRPQFLLTQRLFWFQANRCAPRPSNSCHILLPPLMWYSLPTAQASTLRSLICALSPHQHCCLRVLCLLLQFRMPCASSLTELALSTPTQRIRACRVPLALLALAIPCGIQRLQHRLAAHAWLHPFWLWRGFK